MTIDRNSPMPLYYQLKQVLLARIESGELNAGDIFPTEQQIQETYDVSRTTVRQALSELESEGKITRHRGRGTFVSKPKLGHSPDNYPKLADHMAEQGFRAGWRVLSADWVTVDSDVAAFLNARGDTKVFCLERLRLENEHPIGFHRAYVATEFAGAVDESAFTEGGSLRYLQALSVLQDCVADRRLEAVAADTETAKLLKISHGDPLLQVTRTISTPVGRPVEYFVGVYRGDRFEYRIQNMRAISGINA